MGYSRKNINSVLYGVGILPFILTLFCVLAESGTLANGVVSAKYFWFYLSMGLTSTSIFFLTLTKSPPIQMTFSDWLILFFGASILIVTLIVNHQAVTTKLVLFILLIILYFEFRLLFCRYKMAGKTLCFFLMTTGLIESIIGLRQLYGFEASNHSLFRLTGTFFNPGPYAGYLCIVFPIALYQSKFFYNSEKQSRTLLLESLRRWWTNKSTEKTRVIKLLGHHLYGYTSITTAIATILVIPAAMSRASWIGLSAGSAFVLLANRPNIKAYISRHKKQCILSVVILAGLSVGMYHLKKDSADGRAFIWKTSIQAAAEHPLGVGLGHFGKAYGEAQSDYFEKGLGSETEKLIAGVPEYGFNEYLQIWIESGVISLLLFLFIIAQSIRNGMRSKNIGAIGSLIAMLGFAQFSYPFSVLPILIVMIFLLAWCNTIYIPEKSNQPSFRNSELGLVCLTLCATCLFNRYPTFSAFQKWNECRSYYNANMYEDILPDYVKIYPYLDDQTRFLFEYAQTLSRSGYYKNSNKILAKAMQISCDPMLYNICGKNHLALKEYPLAEKSFKKAYSLVPNRIYPLYLLALLYEEAGNHPMVVHTAQKLLKQKAKVPSTAEKEMKKEMDRINKYE